MGILNFDDFVMNGGPKSVALVVGLGTAVELESEGSFFVQKKWEWVSRLVHATLPRHRGVRAAICQRQGREKDSSLQFIQRRGRKYLSGARMVQMTLFSPRVRCCGLRRVYWR